eukprot:scaffold54397_cov62-Attheya_sp.AAC.3
MRAGLRNTPNMFPAAALKTAAASSPPELFVKTKTILTVSGKQAQITTPSTNPYVPVLPPTPKIVKP